MDRARIYFDHAATTPLDPRVAEAMRPFLAEDYGNPSSLHAPGRKAREAVEQARAQVAELLGADPSEMVFTGSGTEADNLALTGSFDPVPAPGDHLITSAIEHPAILETARYLSRKGVTVSYLPVNGEGEVDPAALARELRPTTRLVSVMAANNVTGVLQPVAELARLTRAHGARFHTDAVQAVGKIPLDVRTDPIRFSFLSPRTNCTARKAWARCTCAEA